MSTKQPSFIDRVFGRVLEAILIYVLLGGVVSLGIVSVLAGHFPPTKLDFKEQVDKMKGMLEKSDQVLTGLQKTNQELSALGPQLQLIEKDLTELHQKVQILEAEIERLKTAKR